MPFPESKYHELVPSQILEPGSVRRAPGQRGRTAAGGVGPASFTESSPSSRQTLSFTPSLSSSIATRLPPVRRHVEGLRQPCRNRELVGQGTVRHVPQVDAVRHGHLLHERDVVARDQHPPALRVGHSRDVHLQLRAVGKSLHNLSSFHVTNLDVLTWRRPFRKELAVWRERQRANAPPEVDSLVRVLLPSPEDQFVAVGEGEQLAIG